MQPEPGPEDETAPLDTALVVFARAPVAGTVKTRLFQGSAADEAKAVLGRALSAEDAAQLHTAFVADLLAKGAAAGFVRRLLYVAGDVSHPALPRLAAQHGFSLREQVGGSLGERMDAAITAELAAGAAGVVLIGSDSPTLPASYLQLAARWLAGAAEVVLGPAADGGYYLVGASQPVPELFAPGPGLAWSSAHVLPTTLERLPQLFARGLRPALLPLFFDCDTPPDLRLLCAYLDMAAAAPAGTEPRALEMAEAPHTRQALRELGLLRTQ